MGRTKQNKARFDWVDTTNLFGCWGYTNNAVTPYCDGYTRLNNGLVTSKSRQTPDGYTCRIRDLAY